jgi:hypothetical protein
MRMLTWVSALAATAVAGPAVGQTAEPRPEIAIVVVTLDAVRQVQTRHGMNALSRLADPDWGRFEWVEPRLAPDTFSSCENDRAERLDYCIRFYLTRAELPADAAPTVVVVFDDYAPARPDGLEGEMRVTCYGRGVVPAEPVAQDTWMLASSSYFHGTRRWDRDVDALGRCIAAAASETWTGLREPDVG